MTTTVGVDIGGSSINVAVRNEAKDVIVRHHVDVALSGGSQIVAKTLEAISAVEVELDAVGVGIPGQVDRSAGTVRMAVNLGLESEPFPLAHELGHALKKPVVVENDVRAAVLGARETLGRTGRRPENLALVSIGTGVAAGVIADGSLIRGATGMAGEIGHVVVDPTGPVCSCGQRGCLETVTAGPAIAREWPKGDQSGAASALSRAAAEGDPTAASIVHRISGHLATALAWLAASYEPEAVVLAGGVVSTNPVLLEAIRAHIEARAASSELAARRLRPAQVVLADHTDPPGSRGAAILAADLILQERNDVSVSTQASNP